MDLFFVKKNKSTNLYLDKEKGQKTKQMKVQMKEKTLQLIPQRLDNHKRTKKKYV
jgi:hypothetical protein